MSLKPNQKKINIILNILKGAQFEFLPQAPFYIHTALPSDTAILPKYNEKHSRF
jgi:hypothetical protein